MGIASASSPTFLGGNGLVERAAADAPARVSICRPSALTPVCAARTSPVASSSTSASAGPIARAAQRRQEADDDRRPAHPLGHLRLDR